MILGYSILGAKEDLVYKTEVYQRSYNMLDINTLTLDEILVDEDITIPISVEKDMGWRYRTVLNAKFQNSIEGGSVQANNFSIEKIIFQKRESDSVEWSDIGAVDYDPKKQLIYEVMDKNIQNDFTYQYAMLPVTSQVLGTRVVSEEIKADFEGVFLSDKDNNYMLLYNIETESIEHNIANTVVTTLNSEFPMVLDGQLDYRSGGLRALFVSSDNVSKQGEDISIKSEKLGRERLLKFLKNKKPKVLRHTNGETMLVRIIGSPTEDHEKAVNGLANVSFSFVEVGKMDSDTLRVNDMLIGLEDDF